jgi:O-antigen/teichoic acid export membrane protein
MSYTVSKQRIVRNTAILLASQLASQALMFFTSIQVANYLGVERYGLYSFAFSFVTLFTFIADCGLNFAAFRQFSRDPGNLVRYYRRMLTVKLVAGALLIAGYLAISRLTGTAPGTATVLFWCFVILTVSSLNGVALAAFQAWERMEWLALGECAQRAVTFALIVGYVVHCDAGLTALVVTMALIGLAALAANNLIVTLHEPRVWRAAAAELRSWLPVLRLGLPFVVIGCLNQIYLYIDIPLMKWLTNEYDVGIYALSARFVTMGVLIPAAVTSAIFPALNRITDQELFKRVVSSAQKYLLLLAVPLGVGTVLLAREFILFFFNERYAPAAGCLTIQIWALVLMCGNWITGYALYALGKDRVMAGVVGTAVAFKIGVGLLLIPRFTFWGASAAMVATEAVIMILELYLLHAVLRYRLPLAAMGKIAVCAGIMGGLVWMARGQLGLWGAVALGVVSYAALVLATRTVTWDEIKQWRTFKAAA